MDGVYVKDPGEYKRGGYLGGGLLIAFLYYWLFFGKAPGEPYATRYAVCRSENGGRLIIFSIAKPPLQL